MAVRSGPDRSHTDEAKQPGLRIRLVAETLGQTVPSRVEKALGFAGATFYAALTPARN